MRALLPVLLLALAAPAGALETAAFLDVGVGARALGLGGAYSALGEDADSLYWNPAGLARLEKREAAFSHAELASPARLDFAAYAHPTSAATFAGGATYLSQDAIGGRDASGRPTADFTASDFAASFAAAARGGLADYGVAVKLVQSHIGSAQAQTVAMDAGARRAWGPLVAAAAVRNLGPGMKFDSETDDLPLRAALGAAYRFPGGHALAAEWTASPRVGGGDAGLGGEFKAASGVFLRAGYSTRGAVAGGSGFDAARGLTLGVGLGMGGWTLDYAAAPMGELGSAHRFTLAWRW
ncbi:MAG: PorV/PorQ family protein [Elusimicrobia bacterium]|nr:PorV/PorQ family protein [Elusimicrobiota bacterium]